jgi:hypothetical protein
MNDEGYSISSIIKKDDVTFNYINIDPVKNNILLCTNKGLFYIDPDSKKETDSGEYKLNFNPVSDIVLNSIHGGYGKYLGIGESDKLFFSTDGETWVSIPPPVKEGFDINSFTHTITIGDVHYFNETSLYELNEKGEWVDVEIMPEGNKH